MLCRHTVLLVVIASLVLANKVQAQSPELTFDVSHYYYEEPNFMDDTSDPAFVSVGLRDWKFGSEKENVDFLYTLEATAGSVQYTSRGTGEGDKDYKKFRAEGYVSYSMDSLNPFLGLGYRWLYDDSGGMVTSTGHKGYDRQSQYVYLPVGVIFELNNKIQIKGQFNYLLYGKQTSYLSDIASFTDLENDQNSGWGTDLTVNYQIYHKMGLYLFYRHWDIEKSETATATYAGVIKFEGYEPANTTEEIGIGISYRF